MSLVDAYNELKQYDKATEALRNSYLKSNPQDADVMKKFLGW